MSDLNTGIYLLNLKSGASILQPSIAVNMNFDGTKKLVSELYLAHTKSTAQLCCKEELDFIFKLLL